MNRHPEKYKQINFLIPLDLHERLGEVTRKERYSKSEYVRLLIQDAVEKASA